MEIYFIKLDKIKYKKYKTYEESYEDFEKLILQLPNSIVEICLEEYCEFGHLDSRCKIYNLCKYDGVIINKYI